MTTRVVNRPARTLCPAPAPEDLLIPAPPVLPEVKAGGPPMQMLLPLVGAMSSMTMMITLRRSPIMVGVGILVMIAAAMGGLVMVFSQRGQATRTRRIHRERYLDFLEDLRDRLTGEQHESRMASLATDPEPQALPTLVTDPARLWERRRTDRDFLRLRIGVGDMPWRRISVPDDSTPVQPADPFMLAEAQLVARRYERAAAVPITVELDRIGNVALIGPRPATVNLARALATQLIALHAPDDVAVALACPPERAADWAWLPWAPHLASDEPDGPIAAPRGAANLAALAALLGTDLKTRAHLAAEAKRSMAQIDPALLSQRLVVFSDALDGADTLPLPDATLNLADAGITVVHLLDDRLAEPGDISLRITVDENGAVLVDDLREGHVASYDGIADDVFLALAEGIARQVAPLRLGAASLDEQAQLGTVDVPTLLGMENLAIDLTQSWQPRSDRDFLRVPIGVGDNGTPLLLDLKESAQLGMGPHGLCVGATGSGKSELLRSVITALAITHPPDDLAMMLVDYKGGAAFAPLAPLPHVAGLITNLADDPGLIERAHASLAGEVVRRQKALKDAGDLADIGQYRLLRSTSRPDLPPLPHLLVVIDEFAELLAAQEGFIDLFLTIGRIGRSIGVHLLLASQRIEAGKLRGLDTYLSYRLGLRTFSESESSVVLDTPDAYHLPPLPGFGWLKVDTSVYTRFRAAYVSAPADLANTQENAEEKAIMQRRVLRMPFYPGIDAANGLHIDAAETAAPQRTVEKTLLDHIVERIITTGIEPARAIWLPTLPTMVTLDQVCGPAATTTGRGLHFPGGVRPMHVPIGLLDDPRRQRQGNWILDLTAAGGHAAIIGGPQTGKSTLLRTVALSLALTHTPTEVAIYGLDLAGGALSPLRALPHVGGIATRTDPERLRRTLEELRDMLDHRERVFRDRGIDSIEHLRTEHAAGRLSELPTADLVLLIDGAGTLRNDFEHLDDMVTDLITRGPGYGLHVVVAVNRWNEIRIPMQPSFGTRIELRLNDPGDSNISRRLAAAIRTDQPGRALTDKELFAHIALPRTDSMPSVDGLNDALTAVATQADAAWPGRRAPGIRVLPLEVNARDLPDSIDEPDRIPIGLTETSLTAATLDLLGTDQHLLVLGDSGSGKTSLLRGIARGLVERRSADELVIALIDPRRGLSGVVPEAHLGGHATTPALAEGLAAAIATQLEKRVSGVGEQRMTEDDPHIVVLIDDYELLTASGRQPLEPLLPYIPAGRDIGLHIVLTRPVAGAARGMWDPTVQSLRDSGAVGLVMTGDRSEGQLFPGIYATTRPVGRGTLVRRGNPPQLVQLLHNPARTENA